MRPNHTGLSWKILVVFQWIPSTQTYAILQLKRSCLRSWDSSCSYRCNSIINIFVLKAFVQLSLHSWQILCQSPSSSWSVQWSSPAPTNTLLYSVHKSPPRPSFRPVPTSAPVYHNVAAICSMQFANHLSQTKTKQATNMLQPSDVLTFYVLYPVHYHWEVQHLSLCHLCCCSHHFLSISLSLQTPYSTITLTKMFRKF